MRFKQNLSQEEVALLLCKSVKGWQRQKSIYNLQHISYYSRLKRFMRGFNGVSTKYLNSYLAWNKPCKLRQRKRNGEEEHFPDFRFDSIENWKTAIFQLFIVIEPIYYFLKRECFIAFCQGYNKGLPKTFLDSPIFIRGLRIIIY